MDLQTHRAHVEALVRRAEDLERRASDAAAEHIRRYEAERDSHPGNMKLLTALAGLAAANKQLLEAIRQLHHLVMETAGSEPPTTRSRRVRRHLTKLVAEMEGVIPQMEDGI